MEMPFLALVNISSTELTTKVSHSSVAVACEQQESKNNIQIEIERIMHGFECSIIF